MYNFVFDIPTRILFGAGQLNNLHKEKLPGKKALIAVSNGQSIKKYGYLQRLEEQLKKADIEYVLFDKVRPNPTAQNVMDGAKLAREKQFDFFTTTLSISPLKRADKLNEIGLQLQQEYEVPYLFSDFKKKNGYLTSIRLSKES